ncbi:zinc ABC transporter substrate-binding protein [uncultured Clostridium sp.]|uniref:metal ABC transporter solute-binding protein, Zn/Mn family n=1 Tax=uncultured Clostridium sp. TaxID=59620 RepID=UPI0025E2E2B2|nr:zinc ABC transporter substrate-binding protein [uncultured Clostridium sp.]
MVGCGKENVKSEAQNKSDKLKVLVSFHAMEELVELIGDDKVDVEVVIPEGTEAHDFEPTTKDIKELSKSKLFVYNGLGMEHWVENFLKNSKVEVVEASTNVNTIKNDGVTDPHTWLGLKDAIVELENIKNALIKIDSKNSDYYEKNYENAKQELESVYDEYKTKFDSIENKKFVTGHKAFGYLCREFGLDQVAIQGVFAEGEPSPAKLAELVTYCKGNNIKTVFAEEMGSTKVAETLAREAGAKVETIETFEGEGDYIDGMRENLEKIYKALK